MSAMRMLATVAVVAALGAAMCYGDTLAPPVEEDYLSPNGRFLAHVTPAKGTAKALLQVYQLEEGRRVAFWDCALGNEGAPAKVFVTDDGMHAVTVNEWSARRSGGWGDYVVAFYHQEGAICHYSLEQILGYPERITEKEFNRLTSRSILMRHWAYLMFLREVENRPLFFVWLDQGQRWLAWDIVTGGEVEIPASLASRFDEIARQWAVRNVFGPGQQIAFDWPAAVKVLRRLKKPEDRRLTEPLLHGQDFRTWYAVDHDAFRYYYAYSSMRNAAEKALAQWDGGSLGDSRPNILDEYRHLGVVRGAIVLPRTPTSADSGYLCIYLIPESSKREDWWSEVPVHRLCVAFWRYEMFSPHVRPGAFVHFLFCGVSPGRYYLKAVWDTSPPSAFTDNAISGPPSPGDYENQQGPLLNVTPGGVIRGVIVDCTQEVGERPITVWSSEVVRSSVADEPPCPCGKEHGRNRICVVFDKALPLKHFDWGPYHNSKPTEVIKEGTTTTYAYVFQRMTSDPNRFAKRDFDMRIWTVARNDALAYVTVEGPYFSVVPLESFLRALMVQGLDARDLEGQGEVYGGPIRPIRSEASLTQVIQALGTPSEAKGDEVSFNYSLRGAPDNDRPRWVKYKVTEDGLLLEGRTNLAGGISFFSFGR
jgi:hypothetical protein